MNVFISFDDMVEKGLKIGRHSAFDMVFGKDAEITHTWTDYGLLGGTVVVDGVGYVWYDKGRGFLFLTA